jgi:CheY-like chemotaxis protein
VPHLPVVLVSGHAADELHRPDGLTPDAFLRKPFELVDLARTVRRLLDRTPSAA